MTAALDGALRLPAAIAASLVLLAVLVWLVGRSLRRAVEFDRRLDVPRSALIAAQTAEGGGGRESGRSLLENVGGAAVAIVSMIMPVGASEREKLTRLLRDAGFGHPDALPRYLAVKGAMGLSAAAACWTGLRGMEPLQDVMLLLPVLSLGAFIAGGVVSERIVKNVADRRTVRMSSALPDALDLLVMCREAGLTIERALETVAAEFRSVEPELAREFTLFERELRVGGARRHAITAFAERTPIEGIRTLAFVLLQSDRYGTPLNESLTNIANNERAQRAARIMERAERLPVLMTIPMLLFVVPGTVALVAGPAFLSAMSALGNIGSF